MRAVRLVAPGEVVLAVGGAEIPVDGGWSSGEPTPIFVPPGASLQAGALT